LDKQALKGELSGGSLDAAEVAKFEAMAAEWWDPHGKFKPLHRMNPVRLDYVASRIASRFGRDRRAERPFEGLRVLDIGCGGGLLSEPMARLGRRWWARTRRRATSPSRGSTPRRRACRIDYRHATAERLAQEGESFDAVLDMEVIEHVADPPAFLGAIRSLMRPGAIHLCSTLNRNAKSWLFAIVGAERIARWLPVGTHDWRKFITPDELFDLLRAAGLRPVDRMGMVWNPLSGDWSLSERDLSVNYVTASVRD
jgi:2-polyprenyl-6-hydroxyphenyl methylase/3-demethylubiquinone-9 3-methyltransferase